MAKQQTIAEQIASRISELEGLIEEGREQLKANESELKGLLKARSAIASASDMNPPPSSKNATSCTAEDVYGVLAELVSAAGGTVKVEVAKAEVLKRLSAAGKSSGAGLRFSQCLKSKSNPFEVQRDQNGKPTSISLPAKGTELDGPTTEDN